MIEENYSTAFYTSRIEQLDVELKKYTQRSRLWVAIRLLTFIGIGLLAYFTFPYTIYATASMITGVILFLFFIRKSVENKEQLNYVKHLVRINENEIKAGHHDYSSFYDGKEYNNPNHPFSYDMDLFAKGGFFQLFNRTVTKKGEKLLADRLCNGIESPKESTDAIDELTEKKEWCQGYLAHGSTLEKTEIEVDVASIILKEFPVKKISKVLRYILPVLAIGISVAYYYDLINGLQFLLGAVLIYLPIRQTLKTTNALHKSLSSIGPRVASMQNQLAVVEKESFSSELLSKYQEELFLKDRNGKKGLTELSKLVKEAEYRDNILVALFLNFFLAWDFRLLVKMENWKQTYGAYVQDWEKIVYELEVLISGANFRFNFKDNTTLPEITDNTEGEINLVNIGHPTIPLKKLVKNSFSLSPEEHFAIITGPNMAGKSTFLRSIGINLMLAQSGFHVMAEKFIFPNMKLYSSMRTNDDLNDETSYFHAELLRLRFIVDAIESGEKVFIILDEILKGTNSKDKEEGSAKFIQKLNQLQVKGIIATHDLSLTKLSNVYTSIVNKYFDTKIEGENISFDYCIHNGVAKNMNASFLLRKMGLIDT